MQSFGAFFLIGAYFCFSISSLILYFLRQDHLPVALSLGFQNIIILMLLSAYFFFRKRQILLPKRVKIIFLRSITGTLYSLAYFFALSYSSFAEVGILVNSFPLFIVLIAWIFLGEKISFIQWGALIFGMFGVWIILSPYVTDIWNAGIIFSTFASIFWAISLIIMQKITDYEDIFDYLFFFYLFNIILLLPFMLYSFQLPNLKQFLIFFMVAVISLFAQSLTFKAYKMCSAAELAPYNFSFAFFHFILAKSFFNFEAASQFYIGSAMIFFGGVINYILFESKVTLSRKSREKAETIELDES
jgi:drug/metabolite transporter (DMT)-like permease